MTTAVVSHVPAQNRFEIHLDGALAGFVDYRVIDGSLGLMHTEVFPQFGGHGVGTTLITQALQQIRELGQSVLPYCSFIPVVIQRHPEFLDLVPAAARPQFGL